MGKIKVEYKSGESRLKAKHSVDYMQAIIEDENGPDTIELYSEAEIVENDETGSYDELKAAILEQAEEKGIPAEALVFWFD